MSFSKLFCLPRLYRENPSTEVSGENSLGLLVEVAYRTNLGKAEGRDTGQQAGSFKEPLPGRLSPDIVYTDQWGRAQSPERGGLTDTFPLSPPC